MYQFCDLDLISTIIVSGAYLIYYLREESHICCMDTSLDADVSHTIFRCIPFWVTLTLTSGLISMFFVSGAYLLYYS